MLDTDVDLSGCLIIKLMMILDLKASYFRES